MITYANHAFRTTVHRPLLYQMFALSGEGGGREAIALLIIKNEVDRGHPP